MQKPPPSAVASSPPVVVMDESLSRVQVFCDPVDCSTPGSSVHGISQARILEWVAIPSFRGSSRPRDWTHVSCIGRLVLYQWASREAPSGQLTNPNGSDAWTQMAVDNSRSPKRSPSHIWTRTKGKGRAWGMLVFGRVLSFLAPVLGFPWPRFLSSHGNPNTGTSCSTLC